MLKHNDQFRGMRHSYLEGIGIGGTQFNYVNPDFYRLVPRGGSGYDPVGYGFDSVAATINTIGRIENEVASLSEEEALARRRQIIRDVDREGIIATPRNSYINELVVEAARLSILSEGETVKIVYGDKPHIEPRHP